MPSVTWMARLFPEYRSNRPMKKRVIVNKRYPHHIRIIRKVEAASTSNDPFVRASGETEDFVIYEGEGRSFTDTTTDGDGKVDTNKRKVSIPVKYDEWPTGVTEVETPAEGEPSGEPEGTVTTVTVEKQWPLDGDEIEITMGNVTERGRVKDFEPDNNRSIVYWEYNRNVV